MFLLKTVTNLLQGYLSLEEKEFKSYEGTTQGDVELSYKHHFHTKLSRGVSVCR